MSELIEVKDWYFTFGCGQEHAGHYVKITAPHPLIQELSTDLYNKIQEVYK